MTETDKIVAAIFTASTCGGKESTYEQYVEVYEVFLEKMATHSKAASDKRQGISKKTF
jgi:hypothetical protein